MSSRKRPLASPPGSPGSRVSPAGSPLRAEALLASPGTETRDAVQLPPEMSLNVPQAKVKTVARPSVPAALAPGTSNTLLSASEGVDTEEEFSTDEMLLNEYVRHHPMLSLEATSSRTLQLVVNLTQNAYIAVAEVPVVPKSHDDIFLSPANKGIGERDCVCGESCLGKFIARVRYGDETNRGFVVKEFLLPDQYRRFMDGKGLPPMRQKCLLCTRYFMNYTYILARNDPNFMPAPGMGLQTFTNAAAGETPLHEAIVASAEGVPTHASPVLCDDGYKPDAMLFVDEKFAQTRAQRETSLGALSFRPFVRFCSTHYNYVTDSDGGRRIVQVPLSRSSIRPLYLDFESAGALAALERLFADLNVSKQHPPLPKWILAPRLTDLMGSETETGADGGCVLLAEARVLVQRLGALERRLWRKVDTLLGSPPSAPRTHEFESAVKGVPQVCLARLLLGSCCEANAALIATRICKPGCRRDKQDRTTARLYRDALLAATWTSAHASYLNDLLSFSLAPCAPCVHSVPSEFSESDLTCLFSRRYGDRTLGKDSEHVAALLGRCTAVATRGWDTVLKNAAEKSEGARRLCANALTVSLLGMTASVHPAARLRWPQRLELAGVLVTSLAVAELPAIAATCVSEVKEAIRRVVANCAAPAYAERAALLTTKSASAMLHSDLLGMPSSGLQAASHAFARAGRQVAAGAAPAYAIQRAFEEQMASTTLPFVPNHIGKVGVGFNKPSAAEVSAELWTVAFRANFIPFWAHASAHQLRASRLDSVQHEALHEMNSATRLVLMLSDREQLRLQRAALRCLSAGILTVEQAAEVGGFAVAPPEQAAASKSVMEAARALGAAGGANAARMLAFSRAAHLAEQVLVYDLGQKTTRMQVSALCKRLLINEDRELPEHIQLTDVIDMIPEHARSLFACLECKRVCNAAACDAGSKWHETFEELGTCASMIDTCSTARRVTLRCSRRCSASLRSAVANEEEIALRAVELNPVDPSVTCRLVVDSGGGTESGVASRVRRVRTVH